MSKTIGALAHYRQSYVAFTPILFVGTMTWLALGMSITGMRLSAECTPFLLACQYGQVRATVCASCMTNTHACRWESWTIWWGGSSAKLLRCLTVKTKAHFPHTVMTLHSASSTRTSLKKSWRSALQHTAALAGVICTHLNPNWEWPFCSLAGTPTATPYCMSNVTTHKWVA